MRARVIGGTAVIAVAALGAFAAIGLGEGGHGTAAQVAARGHATPQRAVHEVATPHGNASAAAVAGKSGKKPKVRYFETDVLSVGPIGSTDPPEEVGGTITCPKKTKVVSGYFATGAPGVALSVSALGATTRDWDIAAFNTRATANTAVLGIVCLQNVK
jgi:hypothetical protein